jgi:predicted DNA-binding antitoxin AbrB/MazE fold protein
MTVRAIYENGVFRPTEPVALAEGTAIDIELPPALPPEPEGHRERLIGLLMQSFDTGDPELAARHNEHQP